MVERLKIVNTEQEGYPYIGTASTGLVACDIFSGQRNGLKEWLIQFSKGLSQQEQDAFTFRFRVCEQVDTDLSRARIVLADKEQVSVKFDPSGSFLIEGPLRETDFRQRLPYLMYTMGERVRQETLGIVTVHGAAASKEGKGVLILGDKGAGKTSTLLGLVLENGYKVIGNDLVLVQGDPLMLVAGSHAIDIRDCVLSKFNRLSHMGGTDNQAAGPYERKTRLFPKNIGVLVEENPVPLSMTVRVNLHEGNTQLICLRELPVLTEILRLNENFSRYIRGITTPVQINKGQIAGYYPSLDTQELCEMRNAMINRLINERPFYYVFASNPSEIARHIGSLEGYRQ